MTQETRLDSLARGWRGPLFAALVALIAGLPGLIALPPLDRDESLFAPATIQMLETGDYINIRYQERARDKKPVLINWLQAVSVRLTSSPEARRIWAFRIPSLLGAMLAAAALSWGVTRFFGPATGLIAGAILGCAFLLSTEAGIAKTDALLCGATTLAMAAFAKLYAASLEPDSRARASWRTKALFWLGIALAILDKGPVGPVIVTLAGLTLWAWDRKAPWARTLDWGWGLIAVLAIVGPWAVAITVSTDGQFWVGSIGGDLANKLLGEDSGHGGPPGLHTALSPLLFFPATALLPAALVLGWRARAEPGVRVAVAWLVPAWLMFEAIPTKLPHYPLPAYGALAWLAAIALTRPIGRRAAWIGAGLSLLAGVVFAAIVGVLNVRFGGPALLGQTVAVELLAILAGLAGVAIVLSPRPKTALAAALALGIATHGALAAGLGPRLGALWLSRRIVGGLDQVGLDPRGGLIPGPVTVVGFTAPSLVFRLGTQTEFGDVDDAAEAISEGRPAVIEHRQDAAFQRTLAANGLKATAVGVVSGLDYALGHNDMLTIYRSDSPPQADGPDQGAAP